MYRWMDWFNVGRYWIYGWMDQNANVQMILHVYKMCHITHLASYTFTRLSSWVFWLLFCFEMPRLWMRVLLNELMDRWMVPGLLCITARSTVGWHLIDHCMYRWIVGSLDGWIIGCMNCGCGRCGSWTGHMDIWIDGWISGWIDWILDWSLDIFWRIKGSMYCGF